MDEIYVIAATQDGKRTELWVAGDTPQRALVRVREHLPPGWMVTLTGESLTDRQAKVLGLNPHEARKATRVL